MSRNYKIENSAPASLVDALSNFYGEVQSLAEEVRERYDNMPENLQGGDLGSRLDETASTLEYIDEIDLPPAAETYLADLTVSVAYMRPYGRRAESRSMRMSNAASWADAVVQAVREWCDEQETAFNALDEEEKEANKDLDAAITVLREFADEVEANKEDAENVEFPGMYG